MNEREWFKRKELDDVVKEEMEIEMEIREKEIIEMVEIFDKEYEKDAKIVELAGDANEAAAKFVVIKYKYFNYEDPNQWRRAHTKVHQEYDDKLFELRDYLEKKYMVIEFK